MHLSISDIFDGWEKKDRNIIEEEIAVDGWIEYKRNSSDSLVFIVVRDGSIFKNLQVVCDSKNFDNIKHFEEVLRANRGSAVRFTGNIVKSPAKGQEIELIANFCKIYGVLDEGDYPLAKAKLPLDVLRNFPHLRVRTRTFQAIGIIRNTLQYETHNFYNKLGFIHVATPLITANDCEGAGETFDIAQNNGKHFFGRMAHLTVSGQLHVETFAHSFDKVYTFGPTFRAENSNTSRHLAEFWMIEPEMTFIGFQDLMKNMEMYLKYMCSIVLKKHRDILEFFDNFYEKGLIERLENVAKVGEDFMQKKYEDCLKFLWKEIDCGNIVIDGKSEAKRMSNGMLVLRKRPEFGDDFGSEIEKYLVEEFGNKPFFLTHFPKSLKSFYMKVDPSDPKLMEATDLLVPGVGELMGGSMREDSYEKLSETMLEKGVSREGLEWYMDMRRYGTAPHGGYGVGFERLLLYVTGMKNIRDVIPFYRTPGQCFA